ncbi:MAG TPA: hypothetical protein VM681_10540 [Candidatus Thermoplasmatota archaeon]|nr:hypothetical protein [Candidatus Thermoplasmatota archaeon]
MTVATERLWLLHPSPRATTATVAAVRGETFVPDRSLFRPSGSDARHPQPADRGEVWVGGDKRKLASARWFRGELRLALAGTVPPAGANVRCHLDVARREAIEEAHTAMHLVVSALARARQAVFTDACAVQGGRHFALVLRRDTFAPKGVADALLAANEAAARRLEVKIEHAAAGFARDVDEQPFADGVRTPGGDVLRVVRIGEASALPCDGTLRTTTAGLGRIVLAAARPVAEGWVLQFRLDPRSRGA